MRSALDLEHLPSHSALAALTVRSQINIRRSRALVALASALVQTARRIRRPRIAGGSEALDFKTWQRFDAERH